MVMGTLTYSGAHARTRRIRGLASAQICVNCPKQAAHWSQIKGTTGQDVMDYEPRCVSCHRKYDGARPPMNGPTGRRPANTSLTEDEVRQVRAQLAAGATGYAVAKQLSVTKQVPFVNVKRTVYEIRAGRNYVTVK